MRFITGISKFLLYTRIAADVAVRYLFKVNPIRYPRFLRNAAILLMAFRHSKAVKVYNGYKLQLYLPAYPSKAFFHTLDSKLLSLTPGPATVVYSITKACNYKCPHCYQRYDDGADVSEAKLIETAKKLRDAGVAMFDIEGGEPFLRFERLKGLVEALDDRSEVWVNTHGGNVTREKLITLKQSGLFGVMISIHSPLAKEHDDFTGIDGSFEKACDAAVLAKELGIVVAVNSVLSSEQIEVGRLDELMELTKNLGCDFVQLIHPKPAGLWLTCDDQIRQNEQTLKFVKAKHVQYNSGGYKNYPALLAQVFEESSEHLGCTSGGVDRFYINAAGEVQPCEFLNMSFGNVNDEPFEKIFTRMRGAFAVPCCDWLCCTKSQEISQMIDEYQPGQTPLLWKHTEKLVENWNRGEPTTLYEKLGIYKR